MAEVNIFGYIGEFEAIQALPMIASLKRAEATGEDVDLIMNCGGGSVIEGNAILNHIISSDATFQISQDPQLMHSWKLLLKQNRLHLLYQLYHLLLDIV